MKKSDLHRKYAWVLDMCEGTNIDPRECVKIGGVVNMEADPVFDLPAGCYTFMVAILEGKPLFVGDEVYWKNGKDRFDWDRGEMDDYQESLTRVDPKYTIMLNGEKLPAPDSDRGSFLFVAGFGRRKYYFKDHEDMSKVEKAINKLLSGK